MSKTLKWLVYRPRAYAVLSLVLFPIIAIEETVAGLYRVVRDLPGEAKEEVQGYWSALIDAYKEWPENVYEVCKREQSRYEREANND